MNKKRLWTFIGLGIFVVLSSAIIYSFYFSKPASFPENATLVEAINNLFPEADAHVIQDTIPVDEHHVLVPFISKKDDYGLSYWVWEKHQWRVASIDTKGEPKIWKINSNQPSSYHYVWNIHPNDRLNSIDFYLIRARGYIFSEGVENYQPRIQIEKKVSLKEKSYGLMQLPDDWATIINTFTNMKSETQPNDIMNSFFPEQQMFFGWIPYNQENKETFPERSVNGNGYSNGKLDMEHVMILNKIDIEVPKEQ